jgi:tRNA (cytidine32/uridine32-2'-O)-methyltransferase
VAVLFGREDRGLTNEELKLCNLHLNIPTAEAYSSLNLAMAVQIVAYELRMLTVATPATETDNWDAPFASREDMERFYVHLEETLVEIGFLDPAAPRQLMSRLRRLYSRVRLDEMELNILRGILTETQKHTGKGNSDK